MAQESEAAERFTTIDYHDLSFGQRWTARRLLPRKSRPLFVPRWMGTFKVVLDGKKPVGAIWFKDRELYGFGARMVKDFTSRAKHTVGEELFRYYVTHRPFLSIYTERLTKYGKNFIARLEKEGIVKVDRIRPNMINIIVSSDARPKLKPHLKWRP